MPTFSTTQIINNFASGILDREVVIYTADHEPAHIHNTGAGQAKVNLAGPDGKPEAVYFIGIKQSDQRRLMADVIKRRDEFLKEWGRIHGQSE